MHCTGFVLVGGRSSRMGRDKALLPFEGRTLAGRVAGIVQEAAGTATLIGDPNRYQGLGFNVVADVVPGCGPMGGLYTALGVTHTDWNLIVACDMPGIDAGALGRLLAHIPTTGAGVVAPVTDSGEAEPLCAVYHRDCLVQVRLAIQEKRFKMKDLLPQLEPCRMIAGIAPEHFANVNTPEEWSAYRQP